MPTAQTSSPGKRRTPLDLNYPDSVQIFDMAFAERVSMVAILSGRVLNQGLARLHRLPSVVRPHFIDL
ncbi:hypothetical protein E0H56_21070 [Rhizobium leguminosarum bv. viciae]|uniref:Uncharacterized protein n=2 Tax=Rhizobium leguminosarum TaxID=384 RepID=A0A7M3E411_RHILE|nr:hypothetical protein [Rhizobium leguminosarum bv. viciae]RWX28762.1 hypothetical protein EHH54_32045 [Rhizobium leguminosarum]NKK90413.1 hypothetical protein [Rhizobium leguminosarum bv. viciae]TAW54830.1 hypothetical protein ELI14_24020 [Rhizobium leguminosarum]TAY55624.1 hypothetical protein ELH90_24945 [Rhizobium leguminosarum]